MSQCPYFAPKSSTLLHLEQCLVEKVLSAPQMMDQIHSHLDHPLECLARVAVTELKDLVERTMSRVGFDLVEILLILDSLVVRMNLGLMILLALVLSSLTVEVRLLK